MTFKIEIKNLGSLISAKNDLEYAIRLEQSKILSTFYRRNTKAEDIVDIEDKIATIDEQLKEIKLSIQQANTNIKDENGNVNNINIYELSIKNRRLALLRDILEKGEYYFENNSNNEKSLTDKRGDFKRYSLISKKRYIEQKAEIEKKIETLMIEVNTIKNKLEKFNISNKVEIKIYEEFQNFIK